MAGEVKPEALFPVGVTAEKRCLKSMRFCVAADCSTAPLESEYGFCEYGMGTFWPCMKCSAVYDFVEDPCPWEH